MPVMRLCGYRGCPLPMDAKRWRVEILTMPEDDSEPAHCQPAVCGIGKAVILRDVCTPCLDRIAEAIQKRIVRRSNGPSHTPDASSDQT